MFKRTKGYLLLTLLVLTGMAGRIDSHTLTGKERKHLINQLKESKAAFLKSTKELSASQLNFKPAQGKRSIAECIQQLTATEDHLWRMANIQLKQDANPEKRPEIMVTDQSIDILLTEEMKKTQITLKTKNTGNRYSKGDKNLRRISADELLDEFRNRRNDLIKFARTSTDDMRNHVVQLNCGYADVYQLVLAIPVTTLRITSQIEEIKNTPHFPKK